MNIYGYTFLSNIKKRNKKGKYLIKIGCTKGDIDKRVKKQCTASHEPPIILYRKCNVNFTDKKVHKLLEKYGEYKPRKRKEWFETDVSTIEQAVNEVMGLPSRPKSFKMRTDQQKAVDQAYEYFTTNSGGAYLWNAKMRFGKTFCAYQLMKKLDSNKTLVLTYKPAVKDEWEKGLNDHIDFEKYNFVKAIEAKKNEILLPDHSVTFASFQDLLQDFEIDEENPDRRNNFSTKPKFKKLLNELFGLVIIDEVHFGATNDPAQKFLQRLNYKNLLYLSGTPFKIINKGELSDDQIFNWTYIDEQNRKKEYYNKGFDGVDDSDIKRFNPYLSLPKMTIIGYTVGDEALNDVEYYDNEEKFTFTKFFNSKDGKTFEHQQAVNHFLDLISDKKGNTSPFFAEDIKGLDNLNHTFWLLPNVNSVHALYYTLKKHTFFKNYEIIPASGNNLGKGSDTLQVVKNTIKGSKYNNKKGTITLSCAKLTTGVTIKEWNAVFLLTNTNSMEVYLQSIFRAQSPNVNQDKTMYKKDCYVFDFDSDRMIKMVYSYGKEHNKSQPLSKSIKEMLDTMNLLCYSDNSFVNLNVNDILSMAENGIGDSVLQKKFDSKLLLNRNVIDNLKFNDKLMEVLKDIKIFRKVSNTKDTYEIASGLGKGKNIRITETSYNKDKKIKDKVDSFIKQTLKRLLTRLPIFMYLSIYVEERIEDVIEKLEPYLFEEVTGITIDGFTMLKDAEAFDIEKLNEAINAFKSCELESIALNKTTHTDILNVMANLSNEEVFTPVPVVIENLDQLPIHVWSDPNLKWFNPAIKNGVWLREVYKRLFKGLEGIIIDPKRREYHIKKHMLYGCTTSNIAWMMVCKTLYGQVNGCDGKHIRWKDNEYIDNIKNKRFLNLTKKELKSMPIPNLVVGNPPFQENDGGGGQGTSAKPIYNLFVEKIIDEINPEYLLFIIPSRWFAGGKGLDSFRKRMQKDKSIKIIKDYPNARKIFPSVEIKGGVCYFLREKGHDGPCMFNGCENKLNKHTVILREALASTIITKITEDNVFVPLSNTVLPRRQFDLSTDFDDFTTEDTGIKCFIKGQKLKNIFVNKFRDKYKLSNRYKIFTPFLHTEGFRIKPPHFIGKPGTISAETYIVLNSFDTMEEAVNFLAYTNTKFFEFVLRQKAITQIFSRGSFMFVPDQQDYTKEYTDKYLYKKYDLTEEEVEFIESKFK